MSVSLLYCVYNNSCLCHGAKHYTPFLPSVCVHNNTRERKTSAFYPPFAFTIIHGSGRPVFLPSICVHNNTQERKTSWSSAPVCYCECKRKVKTGEAGNEAKAYASLNVCGAI